VERAVNRPNRGFTLIELLVAVVLSIFVLEIAWKMLGDQRQNMVGIRQRIHAQSVAREALKSIESEIRIAGFGQGFQFAAGSAGRIDSLGGSSALSTCPGLVGPDNSSVIVTDGATNYNDTLTLAFPTVVLPSTGTDCSQIQWSRYYVDSNGDLLRTSATTFAGLATSTSTTIAAKGVDVFQVRLGVMGGGTTPTTLLAAGTEACCGDYLYWNGSSATVGQKSPSSILVTPYLSASWNVLSSASKTFRAGEKWRDTLVLKPNGAYFHDLIASGATLSAGIFTTSGAPIATVNLLTLPATDSTLSAGSTGLTYSFDLVVPTAGTYKLGLAGNSKTTIGQNLTIMTMNAFRVGRASDTSWWKDPGSMAANDWSAVRQVEIKILSRAESMEDSTATTIAGLANYTQGTNPVGTFKATDKQVRTLFEHIYPVGNNGAN
jgi:type II secretory pathway pseudopilin PulG